MADRDYLAGDGRGKYSIADIAIWPFVNAIAVAGIELKRFPHVYRWWDCIGERPAVQKGMTIPSGQEFPFGLKTVQRKMREDPKEIEERERPLRESLEKAQKEFGYEYRSL